MAIALESGLGVDVDRARLLAVALTVALAYGLREGTTRLWYRRHWDREYGRETWELENYERGEREEMVGLWIFKGLRRSDAEGVIDTLSGYKKFFVGLMMTEELRMFEPNARELAEVAVLTAFIALGAVGPLLAGGRVPKSAALGATVFKHVLFTDLGADKTDTFFKQASPPGTPLDDATSKVDPWVTEPPSPLG